MTAFTWGINGHPSYSMPIQQQLNLVHQEGFTSYRMDFYDASASSLAFLSTAIKDAAPLGITILPMLQVAASIATMTPKAAHDYEFSVGAAFAKGLPSGSTVEIGNELDMQALKPGASGQNASDYDPTKMAIIAGALGGLSDALHAAGDKVIIDVVMDHSGFFKALQAAGVSWDITATHVYVAPGATQAQIQAGADQIFGDLAQFHKPIAITEFNQVAGHVDAAHTAAQANTLQMMMNAITADAAKDNVIGAWVYELLDEPKQAAPENAYGTADATGKLNASGQLFQHDLVPLVGVQHAASDVHHG